MGGAVDIWRIDLANAVIGLSPNSLSDEENTRSKHLRGEKDRIRWIYSRVALRAIVAALMGRDPAEVCFEYGPFGKPRLSVEAGQRPLHFSLTRSGDLCLIATSSDHAVGIDVEQMSSQGGEDWIADQVFTPREKAMLQSLMGPQKRRVFLDLWTRKEACAKAIGMGLQASLRDLDVSGIDAKLPANFPAEMKGAAGWRLISLSPATGYVATLVVPNGSAACRNPIHIPALHLRPANCSRRSRRAKFPEPGFACLGAQQR
jgi:4'-phosphopantetheinyl transferase